MTMAQNKNKNRNNIPNEKSKILELLLSFSNQY